MIFDLKTNDVRGTIAAQPDAAGIIFDEASGLVLVVSGDNRVLMSLKPDVDPKTETLDPPIDLGGKPEFLVSDGAGKVYVNLVDKNEVAVVDIKTRKVIGPRIPHLGVLGCLPSPVQLFASRCMGNADCEEED